MMHISFLFLFFATLVPHCRLNGGELQPYIDINQQIFPFELGKDHFNEHMEDLFRDILRKKALPITSLSLLTQDQELLSKAQQLYDETKSCSIVKEHFAKARESSLQGEALWEWQVACCTINKTLQNKIRKYILSNTDLKKSEIEQIILLAHFAFQQNKYIIEKHICEQSQREHIYRWFVAHNYKGKL